MGPNWAPPSPTHPLNALPPWGSPAPPRGTKLTPPQNPAPPTGQNTLAPKKPYPPHPPPPLDLQIVVCTALRMVGLPPRHVRTILGRSIPADFAPGKAIHRYGR